MAKKTKESIKATQKIQALIIADSFDEFYRPISLDAPRALFPLVNVPMIEYTLEFLASGGVEEVFVFCSSHSDQIQKYIDQSNWSKQHMSVKCVTRQANNVGACMREMYENQLLRSDFILVTSDVVSNVNIRQLLAAHQARKEKDKEAIMTLLFKQNRRGAASAKIGRVLKRFNTDAAAEVVNDEDDEDQDADSNDEESYEISSKPVPMKVGQLVTHPDDTCIAINPESGQLVYYEHKAVDKKATIDLQLFADHPKGIQFRNDLVDTRIAICSTEVLFQFQDNFDYLTLEQFIQGVVQQEIFNAKIFTHIVTNQYYAARANCLRSYNLISRDIISRWTYPLVPDNNLLLGGSTSYSLNRPSIYKENNVNLSRSSTLEEDVVVGNNTDIGDNTFISHSVIGKNCKIGANVRLEGCYLWDNVVIEDNVKVYDSLICSDCSIKKGAVIEKGCLIAYNCVVGEGVRLPPYTKLTSKPVSPAAQQPPRVVAVDLGKNGTGNKWCELERELLLKNYTPRDPAADLTQSLRFTDLVLSEDVTKLFITTKRVTQVDEDNDVQDPEETDDSSISSEELEDDGSYEPSDGDGDFNFNQDSAESGDGGDDKSADNSGDEAERRSNLKRTQSKRLKNAGAKSMEYVSDLQRFNDEMQETVERAVAENHSIDNVVLEINGLKFAYNSSFLDTLTAIFSTLVKLVDQKNYNSSLVKILKKWAPLLLKFIDSTEDQTELIFKIQDLCEEAGNEKLAKAFELVLDTLFDAEILDEDSILQWADEMKGADEADQRFYKQSEKFLTWLREASEGDDDSDGSDADD